MLQEFIRGSGGLICNTLLLGQCNDKEQIAFGCVAAIGLTAFISGMVLELLDIYRETTVQYTVDTFREAAINQRTWAVRTALKQGIDPHTKMSVTKTVLEDAFEQQRYSVAAQILYAGFDVNRDLGHGNTIGHVLCKLNDPKALDLLLTYKPNLNLKNNRGVTPREIAKEHGTSMTLALLE